MTMHMDHAQLILLPFPTLNYLQLPKIPFGDAQRSTDNDGQVIASLRQPQ